MPRIPSSSSRTGLSHGEAAPGRGQGLVGGHRGQQRGGLAFGVSVGVLAGVVERVA